MPAKLVLVLDGAARATAEELGSALFGSWWGFAGFQHKHTLGPWAQGHRPLGQWAQKLHRTCVTNYGLRITCPKVTLLPSLVVPSLCNELCINYSFTNYHMYLTGLRTGARAQGPWTHGPGIFSYENPIPSTIHAPICPFKESIGAPDWC